MTSEARESALDRIGPVAVWLGITVLLVLGLGVMLEGAGQESGHLPDAAPANVTHLASH